MIKVKRFVFNPVEENTYILYDETKECVIVDAGCYFSEEEEFLSQFINNQDLKPIKLINTHCHFDHLLGINYCRDKYRIPFYSHPGDDVFIENIVSQGRAFGFQIQAVNNPDFHMEEGHTISFGNSYLEALHVPGHSAGSIVFYNPEQKFLLSGDVLFHGSIGRTDLPGGSYDTLITNITEKLLSLSDDIIVYPGHGQETTIGFEKHNNLFLTSNL